MSKSLKQKLISGGAWAFSGRILVLISGLIINGLLARLLPPEELGVYFLILSIVMFSTQIALMGMIRTVVRIISESLGTNRPARARSAITKIFLLAVFGIAIVAAFVGLDTGRQIARQLFNSPLMAGHMALVAAWIALFAIQSLLAESFRGFSDIRMASVFDRLLTSLISASLLAWLWFQIGTANLGQILLIIVAACGISVVAGGLLLRRRVLTLEKNGESIASSEIMAISLPLLVAGIAPFIVSEGGIWILGALRPPEEVAIFGAATRLVALIAMPLLVVNAVVAPMIGEMYAQGKQQELEYYLRKIATLGGYAAIGILVVLIIFGAQILELVFGEYFRSAYPAMVILSIGMFVNIWSGSCGQTLMMTGGQKTLMYITLFTGLLMVALSLVVVEPYGITGMASVASGAITLQYLLLVCFAKRHTGMWTHMKLIPPNLKQLLSY